MSDVTFPLAIGGKSYPIKLVDNGDNSFSFSVASEGVSDMAFPMMVGNKPYPIKLVSNGDGTYSIGVSGGSGGGSSVLRNLGSLLTNTSIDVATASLIDFTVGANIILSFAGLPSATKWVRVILRITNGGAFALTWPAGINWAGGAAPALSVSGTDQVALLFMNNGGVVSIDGAHVGKVI